MDSRTLRFKNPSLENLYSKHVQKKTVVVFKMNCCSLFIMFVLVTLYGGLMVKQSRMVALYGFGASVTLIAFIIGINWHQWLLGALLKNSWIPYLQFIGNLMLSMTQLFLLPSVSNQSSSAITHNSHSTAMQAAFYAIIQSALICGENFAQDLFQIIVVFGVRVAIGLADNWNLLGLEMLVVGVHLVCQSYWSHKNNRTLFLQTLIDKNQDLILNDGFSEGFLSCSANHEEQRLDIRKMNNQLVQRFQIRYKADAICMMRVFSVNKIHLMRFSNQNVQSPRPELFPNRTFTKIERGGHIKYNIESFLWGIAQRIQFKGDKDFQQFGYKLECEIGSSRQKKETFEITILVNFETSIQFDLVFKEITHTEKFENLNKRIDQKCQIMSKNLKTMNKLHLEIYEEVKKASQSNFFVFRKFPKVKEKIIKSSMLIVQTRFSQHQQFNLVPVQVRKVLELLRIITKEIESTTLRISWTTKESLYISISRQLIVHAHLLIVFFMRRFTDLQIKLSVKPEVHADIVQILQFQYEYQPKPNADPLKTQIFTRRLQRQISVFLRIFALFDFLTMEHSQDCSMISFKVLASTSKTSSVRDLSFLHS